MTNNFRQNPAAPLPPNSSQTWIFDLDNTLYPAECNLFDQIDRKMGSFIQRLLNVDPQEAHRIQKGYFMQYGTTLRGLMNHHGVHPDDFLHDVHDIDLSPLNPDPELASAIEKLPGRKLVFTNASGPYAHRILEKLGVDHLFDDVYDIAAADYVPKPDPDPYKDFVRRFDVNPQSSLMIEDMARNLKPAAGLGMTTVWLRTPYAWGTLDKADDHVHHQIENLTDWLRGVGEGRIQPTKSGTRHRD